MQTLAAGSILILWGMRDYARADGNGNHGNHGASGQHTKKWDNDFIRCTLQQLGGENIGVGLLCMAFWHGLHRIIGLQCSTA